MDESVTPTNICLLASWWDAVVLTCCEWILAVLHLYGYSCDTSGEGSTVMLISSISISLAAIMHTAQLKARRHYGNTLSR